MANINGTKWYKSDGIIKILILIIGRNVIQNCTCSNTQKAKLLFVYINDVYLYKYRLNDDQ